jgi:hypothetical protein
MQLIKKRYRKSYVYERGTDEEVNSNSGDGQRKGRDNN